VSDLPDYALALLTYNGQPVNFERGATVLRPGVILRGDTVGGRDGRLGGSQGAAARGERLCDRQQESEWREAPEPALPPLRWPLRCQVAEQLQLGLEPVSSRRPLAVYYTHLTLPTNLGCRSRWSPYN